MGDIFIDGDRLVVVSSDDSYRHIYFDFNADFGVALESIAKVKLYDYSPFAIIETDHANFMTITALEHPDNVYPAGVRSFDYCDKRFDLWRGVFEYMRPKKIGPYIVWEAPNKQQQQQNNGEKKWF